MKKLSVRDLCLVGVFVALTAVMAQISIPMPLGVPMTMQTFAISLAGLLLGARKGFAAGLVYVLLGAVGAPVFAGFRGGLGALLGPTGGFLLSFPLMAWLIGLGAEKRASRKMAPVWGLLAGTSANYLCGMLLYAALTQNSLGTAFFACVLPFLPTAAVKAAAAWALGVKLKARLALAR